MKNLDFNNGSQIAEAINKRIVEVVNQALNSGFIGSPIKRGIIKEINGKKYTVKIGNSIYTNIYAARNTGNISINEVVLCVIPNNQYSDMFIGWVIDK